MGKGEKNGPRPPKHSRRGPFYKKKKGGVAESYGGVGIGSGINKVHPRGKNTESSTGQSER